MKSRGGKPLDSVGKLTPCLGSSFVVKHFVSLGVSRRTFFSILERFESGETLNMAGNANHFAANWPTSRSNEFRPKIKKNGAGQHTAFFTCT